MVLPLPQSYVRRQTVCDHSEESAPTMPALVNGGGTFHSATGGTFQSDTDGTFHSDMPGTFESDMDGTFKVMQSTMAFKEILIWQSFPFSSFRSIVSG